MLLIGWCFKSGGYFKYRAYGSCFGVSIGEEEDEELNEVARLCMLRDLDSLAFSSDKLVT